MLHGLTDLFRWVLRGCVESSKLERPLLPPEFKKQRSVSQAEYRDKRRQTQGDRLFAEVEPNTHVEEAPDRVFATINNLLNMQGLIHGE